MKKASSQSWKIFNRHPNADAIAAGLLSIPAHWSLTPLQDKAPRRTGWQIESFIPHSSIADLILHGEQKVSKAGKPYTAFYSGFGLRTGDSSGGLLAIDVDGSSAQTLLEAISAGNIPETPSWTSGKEGRYQLLFQLPDSLQQQLKDFNRAVVTEWGDLQAACDEDGQPIEFLEFRYNRCQSCLPPSRHPDTGAYQWIKSPGEVEVAIAPDWLCQLVAKLAQKKVSPSQTSAEKQREIEKRKKLERLVKWGNTPLAILPAAIVQAASRAARLWCLVRSLDNPINGGTGTGIYRITLRELCQRLKRSERSIWRYLKDAETKGYIYPYRWDGDQLVIEYVGLKNLARHLGLKIMGAIGEFPLEEIPHAKARAADIVAEKLQAQSIYQRDKEWGKFARGAKSAAELLASPTSSAKVPGEVVISRGNRLLYLEPHWRPFGGTQRVIADRLEVSTRTIQYRLSNNWRASRGIPTIEKAQTAHQVFEECPKEFLQGFMGLEENASQKYVWMGRKLFKRGTNLYDTGILLRSHRFRQAEYNDENVLQNEIRVPCSISILQAGSNSDLKFFEEPEEVVENAKRARL
jgi:hypothetical protein